VLPAWSDEFRKGRNIGYQCGSCHECLDRPAPRGTCERGGKVTVHSFDGSPALAAVARRVWREHFEASSEASWRYTVAAVAERGGGTVRFSNSSEEQGAILRDAGGVEVPATTVDDYARTNGLAVDVLKIDTEGNDGLVLLGAAETLRSPSLKLVYFEYAVAPTWFERRGVFAAALAALEAASFVCFFGGHLPRTVRITGCADERWDIFHPRSLLRLVASCANANVFCASTAARDTGRCDVASTRVRRARSFQGLARRERSESSSPAQKTRGH